MPVLCHICRLRSHGQFLGLWSKNGVGDALVMKQMCSDDNVRRAGPLSLEIRSLAAARQLNAARNNGAPYMSHGRGGERHGRDIGTAADGPCEQPPDA